MIGLRKALFLGMLEAGLLFFVSSLIFAAVKIK